MIESKINDAHNIIADCHSNFGKSIVAFSGGKDGIVCGHLVNQVIPNVEMICETSFYYPEQLDNIKEIARLLKFNVTYLCSLSDEWLLKNKQFIFSNDKKIRSQSFFLRQQATIKKFARSKNSNLTFTGRRTEENTVKKILYSTIKNGMQCHPMRDWKETDIWEYFDYYKIPKPWIYNTPHGKNMGNSAFFSIQPKLVNYDISKCWDIVRNTSKKQTFEKKFRV